MINVYKNLDFGRDNVLEWNFGVKEKTIGIPSPVDEKKNEVY